MIDSNSFWGHRWGFDICAHAAEKPFSPCHVRQQSYGTLEMCRKQGNIIDGKAEAASIHQIRMGTGTAWGHASSSRFESGHECAAGVDDFQIPVFACAAPGRRAR